MSESHRLVKQLDLPHPIYGPTSGYGHFGRTPFERKYPHEVREGGKALTTSHKATAFIW